MTAYYNEIDEYAAQWLRNLIAAGHIAPGDVDTRSIIEVHPDDIKNYAQCHFFAGIGVWSYALRRAGWADSRPVWTGSCPCQPFSIAGKGDGFDDERHLWPVFGNLIRERRPPTVFGEQVASKDADAWVDLVQTDMEAMGYAFGAVPFPAAGVGAPHIRDRNYWLGHANGAGLEGHAGHGGAAGRQGSRGSVAKAGLFGGLADIASAGCEARGGHRVRDDEAAERPSPAPHDRSPFGLAHSTSLGRDGRRSSEASNEPSAVERLERLCDAGTRPGPTNGLWRDADWLLCRDGKWRPVEPGTFPLAHGITSRLVYTCAKCKTETVKYENLRTLRKFPAGLEGLRSEAILFNAVLREVDNLNSENRSMRALSGAIQICSGVMQSMQCDGSIASASHRQESQKQRAKQYRDFMSKLSCQRASSDRATNANVQGMPETISSPQMEEQYLFCPVCAGMGPHKCQQEMGPQRNGRLRAYGNAICAESAVEFIKIAMEYRP